MNKSDCLSRVNTELCTNSPSITKAALRRAVHKHLLNSGFVSNRNKYLIKEKMNKQKIRELHAPNRMKILKENCPFINKFAESSLEYFANGNEINPEAINPVLIEVASNTLESNLFRLATLLWSVPVSQGFGRRMRFLVKDRQNDKLIGIFALCALALFTFCWHRLISNSIHKIWFHRHSHFSAPLGGSQYRHTLSLVRDGVGNLTLHLTQCSQVIPTITPPQN